MIGITRAQLKLNPVGPPDGIWPLSISGDGRWPMRADGAPFNMHGCTPWSLEVNISAADVTTYLTDRAARGINIVLFELIEHAFSDNTPKWRNENGDLPFTGTLGGGEVDFTTPNTPYWNHIDWIINQARALGITCMMTPAYVGFGHGSEGWAAEIAANGDARMTTYGAFLGNRYKTFPNIIWVMGGDAAPVGTFDLTSEINALANAIKAASPAHLMTAHSEPLRSSFDDYNQPWLDLNAAYGNKTSVHKEVRAARQQVAKPTFLFESTYGNAASPTMTDLDLRTEMYQGVLGGGCGHFYGQNPLWYFGVNSGASGNAFAATGGLDWHNTLSSFSGDVLIYVRRLQDARPLYTLTPDYAHTKVTAGYDSGGLEESTYCPVMANTQILVAYTRGAALTVNKATFVSATFNVNWYNVRTGATTSGGTAAFGSGSQVFTPPPDGNDWVLLLDDQALSLSNP